MTRSLETARELWPGATEADLGDLKLYWDPDKPEEVKAAKAAFQAAKKLGIAFFRLSAKDAKDGTVVATWEEATAGATRAKPRRVQGVPPVRGGAEAAERKFSSVMLFSACEPIEIEVAEERGAVRVDVGPPWMRLWFTPDQAARLQAALYEVVTA
jgi:hypothetical protein